MRKPISHPSSNMYPGMSDSHMTSQSHEPDRVPCAVTSSGAAAVAQRPAERDGDGGHGDAPVVPGGRRQVAGRIASPSGCEMVARGGQFRSVSYHLCWCGASVEEGCGVGVALGFWPEGLRHSPQAGRLRAIPGRNNGRAVHGTAIPGRIPQLAPRALPLQPLVARPTGRLNWECVHRQPLLPFGQPDDSGTCPAIASAAT
jgi:hypothetical protein